MKRIIQWALIVDLVGTFVVGCGAGAEELGVDDDNLAAEAPSNGGSFGKMQREKPKFLKDSTRKEREAALIEQIAKWIEVREAETAVAAAAKQLTAEQQKYVSEAEALREYARQMQRPGAYGVNETCSPMKLNKRYENAANKEWAYLDGIQVLADQELAAPDATGRRLVEMKTQYAHVIASRGYRVYWEAQIPEKGKLVTMAMFMAQTNTSHSSIYTATAPLTLQPYAPYTHLNILGELIAFADAAITLKEQYGR